MRAIALLAFLAAAPVHAFDLNDLPPYEPASVPSGTIRNFGFGLGGVVQNWETAFKAYHPGIEFSDKFPSGDAAIAALVAGVADLGPQGREQTLIEHLMFFETFGYPASAVTVATGAYDVEGASNGLVILVNKANPIAGLTMDQLDGIFGEARTGGFDGFKWMLSLGRPASRNLRHWGDAGLGGDFGKQPIHAYGHAESGTTNYFKLKVFHGGDKWAPSYRQYVETGSKMIGPDDPTQSGGLHHMLADELSKDRFGIAWTVLPQAHGIANLKTVPIAEGSAGPYVMPSIETIRDHSYPLARSIYIYFNRRPGEVLEPRLREFLAFILSRQGQEIVQNSARYLPLTAELARRERQRLD